MAHNVRVLNDFVINAAYGSQVTIIDAARPHNLIEVGNFPTGTGLCWDADPYLPSGVIIATDKQSGTVFFLRANYERACYLEGLVTDSITGLPLFNVSVNISSVALHDSTNLSGQYNTGYADSGLYMVSYSKPGYLTKIIPVHLDNGVLTILDVQLVDSAFAGNAHPANEEMVRIENNPANNVLNIVLSTSLLPAYGLVRLQICDDLGRVVMAKDISSEITTITRKDLAAGMYFYTVEKAGEIKGQGKIIFQ